VTPTHLLVTGAGGFIGRAVVTGALARGHRVTGVVRTGAATLPAGCRVAVADLSVPDAVTSWLGGVDVVVHCAASLAGDAEAHRRDTTAATEHLVRAAATAGVTRFVLLSSMAVYDVGALADDAVLDESAPLETAPAGRGPYIEAKLAQEACVRDPRHGLDWRILRPGLVFGPGRTWFYHLGLRLHRRLWVALGGRAVLPLTYVGNCAEAVLSAAEAGQGHVIANVVDDDLPTRSAYLEALARRARPSPVVVDVPWPLLSASARLARRLGLAHGMLHPARLAARCKPLRYSHASATRQLGWGPSRAMADALAQSL